MDEGASQQFYPVTFTGRGGQFFKIWIVNILLTILTLYIYSAWAKIRSMRYFYGNTVIDGSSFEYHARPLQILLSRMVAALLFIGVTVGQSMSPYVTPIATAILFLIIPWAIWRSTKFTMRMTSYRNVRFGFDGSVWTLYLYQLILPIMVYAFIGAGFYFWKQELLPGFLAPAWVVAALLINFLVAVFTHKRLSSYFLNGYLYGKSRFTGDLSLGYFFQTYALATILTLGTLAVVGFPFLMNAVPEGMSVLDWVKSIPDMLSEESLEEGGEGIGLILKFMLIFYVYLFIVGYFVAALIRARSRNHVFANAVLDNRVEFKSTITTIGLWWIMFTNVLLMFVTLGLARPFTQVRMARYFARHSSVLSAEPLDNFVGEKRQEVGAFGDELGDVFDVDMDVGF